MALGAEDRQNYPGNLLADDEAAILLRQGQGDDEVPGSTGNIDFRDAGHAVTVLPIHGEP